MQGIQRLVGNCEGPSLSENTRQAEAGMVDIPDSAPSTFSSFHSSTNIQRCIGACVLPKPRSLTLLTTSPLIYIPQNLFSRPRPSSSPRTFFQMFRTLALTVLLFTALAARADVVPTVPGPGVVYKTGGVCHIEWDGDKDSNTIWKDTAIELMSGSNLNMVFLTSMFSAFPLQGSYTHSTFSSCCNGTRWDRIWVFRPPMP